MINAIITPYNRCPPNCGLPKRAKASLHRPRISLLFLLDSPPRHFQQHHCMQSRALNSIPTTSGAIAIMNPTPKPSQNILFQVYLRLRPPISQPRDIQPDRCLIVDPPEHNIENAEDGQDVPLPAATHITLQPPADSRKRAVERFGFTQVFDEAASQIDVFQDTGMNDIIRGVLLEGRDGLIATLGVTGSGKVGVR